MCRIGPGLFLPHTQGTVIGAASIGANCTIYQNVTIGARELDLHFDATRRPVIEDNVVIGAGAKVIGALVVGEGAKIGSNANIVGSVPAQALALAPAAEIRLRSPKASE